MTDIVRSPIRIAFPYTHSAGSVTGRALAALRDRRILGSRCSSCGAVGVPAREWCDRCGGESLELSPVGPGGEVRLVARVHEPTDLAPDGHTWITVRLDGADCDLVHVAKARDPIEPGTRVVPVWRAERTGAITDIERFTAGFDTRDIAPTPGPADEIFHRTVSLPYTLSAGALASRFFDGVKAREIHGVRCTSCETVMVPPSVACPRCWADTDGWIRVADRGVITTFVVVNVPFHGQEMPLPYVLARVLLDGAGTSFLHVLGECDPADARMGMRVEAVWRDGDPTGFPADDIRYFRPTGEPDAPPGSLLERL